MKNKTILKNPCIPKTIKCASEARHARSKWKCASEARHARRLSHIIEKESKADYS